MARIAGTLSEEEVVAQDHHVSSCSACQELFDVLLTGSANVPSTPSERVGDLGRYKLQELLGMGGMGMVYAAYDPSLDRKVAIKLVRTERANSDHTQLLEQEARAMARIRHPNVARVFEVGRIGEEVFVAMELIDGKPLKAWVKEHRPDRETRLRLLLEAGRGLQAVHAAGLVHRDFKASNVLVQPGADGPTAVVIDFGLSIPAPTHSLTQNPPDTLETSAPRLIGTPAYMAPEQIDDGVATEKSDQFSFCVTVFEVLTGNRPFGGGNVHALRRAMEAPLSPTCLRTLGLSRKATKAIARGLSFDPYSRWPNMPELLEQLQGAGRSRPRRSARVAVSAFIVLAPVAVAPFLSDDDDDDTCPEQEARVHELWNVKRHDALARHLSSAGDPSSVELAGQAVDLLDDYVEHWSSRHQEACRTPHLGFRRCLDRRLDSLGTTLEAFSTEESVDLRRVIDQIYTLPSTADCTTESLLPPPDSEIAPEDRKRVARSLARARAFVGGGEYDKAAQKAGEAATVATELGDMLGVAESLLVRGRIAEHTGDFEAAQEMWSECLVKARSVDAYSLASACGSQLALHGNRSEAHRWAAQAVADARRSGGPVFLANALSLGAYVSYRDGDLADAEGKVAEAFESLDGADTAKVDADVRLGVMMVAATIAAHRNRFGEAIALQRTVVAQRRARYGREHPDTAFALVQLGSHLGRSGDVEAAIETLQEAVELTRLTESESGPLLAQALFLHGVYLLEGGELETAQRTLLDASSRLQTFDDKTGAAMALHALGQAAEARGDLIAAHDAQTKGLAASRSSAGAEHPDTAIAEVTLGMTLLKLGRDIEDAAELIEHGSARLVETEDQGRRAVAHGALGLLAQHQGNPTAAVEHHRRALSASDSGDGRTTPQSIQCLANLAEAQMDAGDVAAARRSLARADTRRQTASDDGAVLSPSVLQQLKALRVRLGAATDAM